MLRIERTGRSRGPRRGRSTRSDGGEGSENGVDDAYNVRGELVDVVAEVEAGGGSRGDGRDDGVDLLGDGLNSRGHNSSHIVDVLSRKSGELGGEVAPDGLDVGLDLIKDGGYIRDVVALGEGTLLTLHASSGRESESRGGEAGEEGKLGEEHGGRSEG